MFELRCLEAISRPLFFLAAYWIIFFWKFLKNPYLLSTSEIASTFFPHWVWVGRELRQGKFPAQDEIYYKLPGSIPFLSTFYPLNLIASYLGSFLKLDIAFKLYAYFILSHYLLGSFLAYQMFSKWCEPLTALFGSITLTYSAYCIKPQTPAFVYTIAWIPLAFMGSIKSAIGFNMSLLGGYYPILVYLLPIIALKAPYTFFMGCLLATPQLLPFWGYFKRSVRSEPYDKKVGRIPWKKLIELILPIQGYSPVNGVHYPEVAMYMGIAPLFIFRASWWWVPLIIGIFIACGIIPSLQRIPARTLYLISFSISFLAVLGFQQSHLNSQQGLNIVLLTAFLLLHNSSLYPSFPFSQWWDKPSILYSKKPKANNWPFATGYLEGIKISEYRGAFRLK